MNNNVGEAVYTIRVDDQQAFSTLDEFQDKISYASSAGGEDIRSLSDGFATLTNSLAQVATAGLALGGLSSTIGDLTSAYNNYQASMNGVKAVATATGNSISESFSSIQELTASGLITQEDAAAAMKNLQLYGYSVEEATEMIKTMTDAAVYNRQANYSVSEAVRVTTEGIRMENSVLSDASGVTTNIAKMHENYAAQLGKTAAQLTDVEKAQAVYNGYLQEGGVFAGNAESYTNTLAGAQQSLNTSITQVKQTMGAIFQQFAPIISGIANWISQNKQLVAAIGTMIGILTAAGGLVVALMTVQKVVAGVSKGLATMGIVSSVAQGGIIGLVTAVAALGGGILAANAIGGMVDDMSDTGEQAEETSSSLRNMAQGLTDVGMASIETAGEISKVNDEIAKLDRDYRRSLKKIAENHEQNLTTLTQQIEEANVDYRRAIDERMADFNVTLAKQERSHQETVDELMTQLSFLQRYNNDYNKEKLAQVQFALNKEEELYRRETAAQQAEIDLQNEADRAKYEQKLASLQGELEEELAFMNKHRDALNSVRDVILLDEIESLQEQYNEQKASYAKQIEEAAQAGVEAGRAYSNGFESEWASATSRLKEITTSLVTRAKDVVGKVLSPKDLVGLTSGFAGGGYTGRGAVNEVAGVVHRGEYVVPASQVDQSTGEPKLSRNTFVLNFEGVLATSEQAKRDLANTLVKALQQTQQSRLQRSGSL